MTDYVKKLNETYPPGTRLELLHMDDPYAPVPVGTRGTVNYVSDYGGIDMKWDNGRTLSLMPDKDKFRPLSMDEIAEEEIAKGHSVVSLGDDCQIVLPDEPVDCSSLGYFDELEEECWDLVKSYCSRLGIKMIPDEDGKPPISFDIAKGIQDQILGELQNAGVRFNFDEISEDMDNIPIHVYKVQSCLAAPTACSRALSAGYSVGFVDALSLRSGDKLLESLRIAAGERKYLSGTSWFKISDNIQSPPLLWDSEMFAVMHTPFEMIPHFNKRGEDGIKRPAAVMR